MDETIREILMRRDGLKSSEADDIFYEAVDELKHRLAEGYTVSDVDDICYEYFGLEPDYIDELIGAM